MTQPVTSILSDTQAIELVRRGRPGGLETLYDRYGEIAHSLALHILREPPAAEAVVEEAFLSVWVGRAAYDGARGSVRDWLCSLVHRLAIDRRRTHPEVLGVVDTVGAVPAGARRIPAAPARERSRAALAALPDEQREVVELAYFAGYSQVEMSDRLRLPLDTVKALLGSAFRSLRQALPSGGGEGDQLPRIAGG